jgi:hypothetical protein
MKCWYPNRTTWHHNPERIQLEAVNYSILKSVGRGRKTSRKASQNMKNLGTYILGCLKFKTSIS